jgi:hypothetical protein
MKRVLVCLCFIDMADANAGREELQDAGYTVEFMPDELLDSDFMGGHVFAEAWKDVADDVDELTIYAQASALIDPYDGFASECDCVAPNNHLKFKRHR